MQPNTYTPRVNDIGPVSTMEPHTPPEAFTSAATFAAWHSAQWERKDAESAVRSAESWLIEQIPADLVDVEFIYSADTAFRLGKDKRIHIRNTTLTA